jgi:hypothetical protein
MNLLLQTTIQQLKVLLLDQKWNQPFLLLKLCF